MSEAPAEMNLDAIFWEQIKDAANKSPWITKEYTMNEVVSDICSFLTERHADLVPKVKSLAWEPNGRAGAVWSCVDIGHDFLAYYTVEPYTKELESVHFGILCHEFGSTEIWRGPIGGGIDAANADNKRRILSALETPETET